MNQSATSENNGKLQPYLSPLAFCFVAAMIGHGHTDMTMKPDFVTDSSAFRQVLRITRLSTD